MEDLKVKMDILKFEIYYYLNEAKFYAILAERNDDGNSINFHESQRMANALKEEYKEISQRYIKEHTRVNIFKKR